VDHETTRHIVRCGSIPNSCNEGDDREAEHGSSLVLRMPLREIDCVHPTVLLCIHYIHTIVPVHYEHYCTIRIYTTLFALGFLVLVFYFRYPEKGSEPAKIEIL
jgi:hypothetical protein